MSNRYGLIGFPLGHSFSRDYFTEKFKKESIDAVYDLFPIKSIVQLSALVNNYPDLKGINVTIPYKQVIIPFLNSISEEADKIGAVNTVKVIRDNNNIRLEGYNTDAPAFEAELKEFITEMPEKALILGTGGSSAAVAFVLKKLGIDFRFVSREPHTDDQIAYIQVDKDLITKTQLIINCTPMGMLPDVGSFPEIPYKYLTSNHYLFDLVYNPETTEFLRRGKSQKANTKNGLSMLYKQADFAWKIWNEKQ